MTKSLYGEPATYGFFSQPGLFVRGYGGGRSIDLDIIGLMCIPPNDDNTDLYFKEMQQLNKNFGFSDLSMGMSSDYVSAIENGATYIRVGSKIFGDRSK